jgi:putative endonuclease
MARADGDASPTRRRGDAVEDAALAHLQAHGLRLLARNAATRGGELDLVMLEDGPREACVVVFVEVRYRAGDGYGGGAASVDARKRRKLVHAARVHLARHPQLAALPCRFDVVEASGDPHAPRLHWIRDAFRADD